MWRDLGRGCLLLLEQMSQCFVSHQIYHIKLLNLNFDHWKVNKIVFYVMFC